MATLEDLAAAALSGDALGLRSLALEWLRSERPVAETPRPDTTDVRVLAVSAALAELFAQRLQQPPPPWTSQIGPLPEPIFLVRSAARMKRLRQLCENESPLPLRRRRLFAPPNFLESA